jgi:predicted RNA-binding protein with EMAP domain
VKPTTEKIINLAYDMDFVIGYEGVTWEQVVDAIDDMSQELRDAEVMYQELEEVSQERIKELESELNDYKNPSEDEKVDTIHDWIENEDVLMALDSEVIFTQLFRNDSQITPSLFREFLSNSMMRPDRAQELIEVLKEFL